MNTMAQLKPALIRLRMSGILERLEDRIREAQEEKWAYTDFLLALFRDEIERRDFKTLSLRLKRSELDPQKTLETFDFSFNARIHEPAVKELASCFFIEKHENVFLLGPSGVGKSHLACALGHEAARRGYDVLFRRTASLLKWLGAGRGDGTYERRLKSLACVPLLILDDFGLNDLSLAAQNDLYEIICVRYETASLIITSNRDFAEWQNIFENQLLASAAMDRLVHKARKIVIEGRSYRLDSFSKLNSQSDLTHS
jgi:DNA replication protein DnaC